MKKLTLLPALLGLLLSFQAQAANIERVRVTTNFGAFVIEMQRDRAPLTVENFLGTCATAITPTRCFTA